MPRQVSRVEHLASHWLCFACSPPTKNTCLEPSRPVENRSGNKQPCLVPRSPWKQSKAGTYTYATAATVAGTGVVEVDVVVVDVVVIVVVVDIVVNDELVDEVVEADVVVVVEDEDVVVVEDVDVVVVVVVLVVDSVAVAVAVAIVTGLVEVRLVDDAVVSSVAATMVVSKDRSSSAKEVEVKVTCTPSV